MTVPTFALAFHDVRIALGSRAVLSDVNLGIAGWEFVGVPGPNGAGKTALIRAVLGRPAAQGNPHGGYMLQTRTSVGIAGLSGRDFVAGVVDGHRLGLPLQTREGRTEVDRVLGLVDGRDLARRPLSELSGGERQRLLLAAMDRVMYLGRGEVALGTVEEVITGPVLSRLYRSEIDMVRVGGRIFVMSGTNEADGSAHGGRHGHA